MENKFIDRYQFLLQFAYIGSRFFGVQEQKQVPTVMGAIRKRIERIAGQKARSLCVAARTDKGVHALHNYVTFYLKDPLAIAVDKFSETLVEPADDGLFALKIYSVSPHVHARGSSRGKLYRYSIMDQCREEDLDRHPYAFTIVPKLSVEDMVKAASFMVGEMDFSSLRGGGCQAQSPIKQIFAIDIVRTSQGMIVLDIFGNAFLRKMIRNLVGLLVEVGAGLRPPWAVADILALKDRQAAGIMAPPQGLCLMAVKLDDSCLN